MAGCTVGLCVWTADGMAGSADRSTRNRRGTDTVAARALGGKITGCWNCGVVVEIFYRMRSLNGVAIVTGSLITVLDVGIMEVHAHLGFVHTEGLMLLGGLPVGVAAPRRHALAPVLAEVAVQANVTGWNCGLGRVVAHTA